MVQSVTLAALALTMAAVSLTPALAQSSAASATLTTQQRSDLSQAEAAFSRYLRAWSEPAADARGLQQVFMQRAVLDLTMTARPHWSIRVKGTQAIAEYLSAMRSLGAGWKFSNIRFFPTLERGVVFVQYEAVSMLQARGYRNMVIIDMSAGRIARLRDFNSAPLMEHGLPGGHPSATPAIRLAWY